MSAIICTGGKQYSVSEGDIITVEKLDGDAGTSVVFDKVLMLKDGDSVEFGTPTLDGREVSGEIVVQERDKKIEVVKFRRRKRYLRRSGHRQHITKVKITAIK